MKRPDTPYSILNLLWNLVLLYLLYFLCRVVYVCEFWDLYADGWQSLSIGSLLWGGLRFDTAAIAYTCLPWALFFLLPVPPRLVNLRGWQLTAKSLFVVINTVALWSNLVDTVYSRYTGRRTTATFFSEFSAEGNLGSIFGTELLHHWYLVLIGLAFLAALIFLYAPVSSVQTKGSHSKHRQPRHRVSAGYYVIRTLVLVLFLLVLLIGIRGGVSYHRPIGLSDANGYVNQPKEANIVLNTPFSLIRTIGKTTFSNPGYYTPDELDALYSPIKPSFRAGKYTLTPLHQEYTLTPPPPYTRNVVILILESFGQEYWGCCNQREGYTPFLDSLAEHSLLFPNCFANGRKSIDALPSVLSSIPMFVEPYILTPYANNEVSSIAGQLLPLGYRTAFFHGADNGSMGFQAYSRSVGFQTYYGMDEYCRDTRFHGADDFDGYWAIWDEEFLQYFSLMLDTLPQPFMTTLFTATSHHPFNIPSRYATRFTEGTHPIYKAVQYTDYALRQFFRTAAQSPWFKNTLFVITADHTNYAARPEYKTGIGSMRVPILIYDPSGDLPTGVNNATAQQIDIMPTLLPLLGVQEPFVAFGIDLLNTPEEETWAINYTNGFYQYVRDGWLILFDGQDVTGLYRMAEDPLLHNNLAGTYEAEAVTARYLPHLKAVIQSYMTRMTENRLTT